MASIGYDAESDSLELKFPYDLGLVEKAKTIFGYSWVKSRKCWRYPASVDVARQIVDVFDPDVGPGFAGWWTEATRARRAADNARALLNGGAELSGDLELDYHKPSYDHQHRYCVWAATRDLAGVTYRAQFSQQGTGKTKSEIDITVWEIKRGICPGMVLVFCPNSVKRNWKTEFYEFSPGGLFHPVAIDGSAPQKVGLLENLPIIASSTGEIPVAIINYDVLSQPSQKGVLERLRTMAAKGLFGKVIFDESQMVKNSKSGRGANAFLLAKEIPVKVVMTGTPYTQSPLDAFNQMRVLSTEILGANFHAFKRHHVEMGGWQGREVVGYRHEDELEEKVNRHAYRVLLEDCVDMPEEIDVTRVCDMSPEQIRVTKEVRSQLLAVLEGEDAQAVMLSASNALSKLVRFNQITSGFIEDDRGRRKRFEPNPKLDLLMEIVNGEVPADEKIVVWCAFKADVRAISDKLTELKMDHATYFGDMPDEKRAREEDRFRTSDTCRVMVATPDTGGIGLNWQAACWCIFYSYGFNWGLIDQARARIRRITQKQRMQFVWLVAENPETRRASHGVSSGINSWTLQNLKEKSDIAEFMTGDFRKKSGVDPRSMLKQALEVV